MLARGRVTAAVVVAGVAGSIFAAPLAIGGVKHENAVEFTLKFGYVTGRPHPYGQTMTQFEANVEKASAGRIDVVTLPVYAQGSDEQLYADIKGGTVEGGAVSTAVWPNTGGVKAFIPLQMPFLLDSYKFEERIINGSSGVAKRMIASASAKSGLKVLGVFEGGMRHIVTKDKPINSLADLSGKKLRAVPSNPLIANMKALGISPVPLTVGQVFQGLKDGVVDGAEANSALIRTFRWNEAGGQHVSLINWFPFPAAVAMNQAAFDKLPADLQKVITDQAVALPTFSISVVDGTANKIDIPTLLCNAAIGPVKYHKVPDAVRKQMIKKSQGVIKAQIKDPEVRAIYNTIARLKSKFPTQDSDLPPATCLE